MNVAGLPLAATTSVGNRPDLLRVGIDHNGGPKADMPQTAAGGFFLIFAGEIEQVQGEETLSDFSSGELAPATARHQHQSSDPELAVEIEWPSGEPQAIHNTSRRNGSPPEARHRINAEPQATHPSADSVEISWEPASVEKRARGAVLMPSVDSEALPVEPRLGILAPAAGQSTPAGQSASEDASRPQLVPEKLAESFEPLAISESRAAAEVTVRAETATPALASPDSSVPAEWKEPAPGTRPPLMRATPTAGVPPANATPPAEPISDVRLPAAPMPDAPGRDASGPNSNRQLAVRYESVGLEQQGSDRTLQALARAAGVRHSEGESQAGRGQLSFAARIHLGAEADGGETPPSEQKQAAPADARAKTAAPRPSSPAVRPLPPRVQPATELPAARARQEQPHAEFQAQGMEKRSGSGEISSLLAHGAEENASHSRVTTPKAAAVLPAVVTENAVRSVLEQPSAPRPEAPRTPVVEPPSDTRVKAPAAHEIHLSVSEGEQTDIHLKLVERGGKIHLAVRSSQPELASRMQQDVGKLVTRLGNEFGHTESWTPGKEVSVSPGETGRDSPAGAGDFHGNQGSNDAGGGQSRGRRDEQERPEWITEFLGEDKNEKRFQEEVLQWLKAYRG